MADIKKQSRSGSIVTSIRNRIFNGELISGTRLIEQDIAREFGMSRGPVREALQELEYEGLVVSEVNKGCTIAPITGEDAYEIFYLRGSLEKMALEICGGKIPEANILVMRNIIEDMRSEENGHNNMQVKIECDERFHEEIMKTCKMKRLYNLWKSLSPLNGAMFFKIEEYHRYREEEAIRNGTELPSKNRRKLWSAHQEMLDLIEKGDLEAVIKLLEEHYLHMGTKIFRWEMRMEDVR